ncbi:MAG: laminin B domain-containing protein [Rhodothermales bacterium]
MCSFRYAFCLAFGLLAVPAVFAQDCDTPQAAPVSTFDADVDCWTTFNDARDFVWVEEGGNPGGHVEAQDRGTGVFWYWQAPGKFLGDKGAAYGDSLRFDLRLAPAGSVRSEDDVVLIAGDGTTLRYRFSEDVVLPLPEWQRYAVPLSAGPWLLDGTAATTEQMQAVLADLATLRIRAEYRFGAETGSLDNVALGTGGATGAESPSPATTVALDPAYPNPFARSTALAFGVAEPGPVRLSVYDVLGREVAVLVDGRLPAGRHEARFDARGLASGLYVYRLQTAGTTLARRVVLAR